MTSTQQVTTHFKGSTTTSDRKYYVQKLKDLADECRRHECQEIKRHPFASGKFDSSLRKCVGFRGQLSSFQFDVMVRLVADEVVNEELNEHGHISEEAIARTEFGSLLRLVLSIYTQTYGIAETIRIMNKDSQRVSGYSLETAANLMLMLERPTVGMNGRIAESLLQLTVRKKLQSAQVTNAIKHWAKSKVKDYVFKKAKRGTAVNLQLQVPLDIGDRTTSATLYKPLMNQEIDAGLVGDFDADASNYSACEMMLNLMECGLSELTPKQKEIMTLFFKLCEQDYFSSDPRITFKRMVKEMKPYTAESTHGLGVIADQIGRSHV